jgi:site-specific recombinase XerD
LGGDSERSRVVAETLKVFIDGMRDPTQHGVIESEKERLIRDAQAAARAAAPMLCNMRHNEKTACPHHKKPAEPLVFRKKPISKAAEAKARSERIRQMERSGDIETAAPVLTCADMAELMFSLWVAVSPSGLYQCLAQLAVLTYLFGSRLNEVFDLGSAALDQARCRFKSVRKKKVREYGRLRRSAVYTAQATTEEQDYFKAVWQLMRFDEGLLFADRWGSAKVAARKFKECQQALGLQHIDAMGGGSSLVTGHTFRRSRGIHLLQHGRKREDIQELYKHEQWSDTAGYLDVGAPLWQLENTVPFSEGVFALLRKKLDERSNADLSSTEKREAVMSETTHGKRHKASQPSPPSTCQSTAFTEAAASPSHAASSGASPF